LISRMTNLVVKVKPRGSQTKRLFLAVGATVSKKAVVRNRLKRRLRVIMGPILEDNKDRDFLVVARPGAANLTFAELEKEIREKIK